MPRKVAVARAVQSTANVAKKPAAAANGMLKRPTVAEAPKESVVVGKKKPAAAATGTLKRPAAAKARGFVAKHRKCAEDPKAVEAPAVAEAKDSRAETSNSVVGADDLEGAAAGEREDSQAQSGPSVEEVRMLDVLEKLPKPMALGSWTGDIGEEADLVAAVHRCLDDLSELWQASWEPWHAPEAPPEAAASSQAGAAVEGTAGSYSEVTDMAGNTERFAVAPSDRIADLRAKVSSWKGVPPCQVKLVKGYTAPTDSEMVGDADRFSLVVRDIQGAATSTLRDLANLVRLMFGCGLRSGRTEPGCPKPYGLPGAWDRINRVAYPWLSAARDMPDAALWAARTLYFADMETYSVLTLTGELARGMGATLSHSGSEESL